MKGKRFQWIVKYPLYYRIYTGIILDLPVDRDLGMVHVRWYENWSPFCWIMIDDMWRYCHFITPKCELWNHYRERRIFLFAAGDIDVAI